VRRRYHRLRIYRAGFMILIDSQPWQAFFSSG